MDELPSEAKRVLALAKRAQPGPEDGARERVRQRIEVAVVAAALAEGELASGGLGKLGSGRRFLTSSKVMLASTALFIGVGGALLRGRAPVASPPQSPATVELAAAPSQAATAHDEARHALRAREPARFDQASDEVPAPAALQEIHTPHAQGARARPANAGAGEPSFALAAEMSLLSQAADALAEQDTSRARLALNEHQKRFRHPQLREEREGLSVLTRCMERPDGAQGEARSFVHKSPSSILAARIKQACRLSDDS
jgi:hypothetical protein